jgi:hypothetical protein
MVPVTRQMRAYFAPVNRVTETPTIFDPGQSGLFALDSPPAPWLDLGWVENFERWYDTPTDVVQSGRRRWPRCSFAVRWRRGLSLIFGSGGSCKWRWRAGRRT